MADIYKVYFIGFEGKSFFGFEDYRVRDDDDHELNFFGFIPRGLLRGSSLQGWVSGRLKAKRVDSIPKTCAGSWIFAGVIRAFVRWLSLRRGMSNRANAWA